MKRIFPIIFVFVLTSCGGSGGGSGSIASDKNLAITVHGSKSFNPDVEPGKISSYFVSISGPDMADPVTDVVAGTESGTTIYGIAPGTGRQAEILAYNKNGQVIRRALKTGITVLPGLISNVDVTMRAVPIITNINPDGAAVASNRINFEIFGEPGSSLTVSRVDGEEETKMIDASTNVAFVITDNEEGLFEFDPGTLDFGNYTFKVEDAETHESSTVTVALYKTLARPGVAFGAGGSVGKIGDELVVTKAGGAFYQNTQLRKVHVSSSGFLNQVDILSE